MRISLTGEALAFLKEQGTAAVTVSSLVFSACCSGPLPPEVRPGAPQNSEGFAAHRVGDVVVYYDSLLDPRPEVVIDLREFPRFRELLVREWD